MVVVDIILVVIIILRIVFDIIIIMCRLALLLLLPVAVPGLGLAVSRNYHALRALGTALAKTTPLLNILTNTGPATATATATSATIRQ